MEGIYCLMFTGAPLDNGLRTALFLTGCGLIRTGQTYAKFTDENGEGGVSTKNHRRVIGGVSGIEFEATVDWKNKTITCRYLVRDVGMPTEEEVLDDKFRWAPVIRMPGGYDADWWKNK